MAFGITVHRRADDALYRTEPDVGSEAFDDWIKECQARWVYENPLGADGTVFNLWHVPAHELGLPLLGSIYQNGLRVEGAQLAELSRELDALEAFWAGVDFSRATPLSASTIRPGGVEEFRLVPLEQHLRERLGCLREALQVAVECDGVVEIG
jgi:hypothetical protein